MQRQTRADLAMTAAILVLGASLVYSGISLLRLRWQNIRSAQPLDLAELLGVAGAGAGVALLCWWILAMACACVSAVAHEKGAAKVADFTASCSPAFMRRVVIAVLGLNLMATPLLAAAQAPGLDPLWRAETVATTATASTTADVLPPNSAEPVDPQWLPHAPDTDPDLLLRPATRPAPADAENSPGGTASEVPSPGAPPSTSAVEVVVKSGDSLWTIVAAALGPFCTDVEVAQAWPRWYNANRDTIGEDPHYILPGQVLHAPSGY
ncbi:LysM peptidoglycan-binding domain-containing protein [Arthrobacter sp. TMN-49]